MFTELSGPKATIKKKTSEMHNLIFNAFITYHRDQKLRWMLLLSAIQQKGRDL